MRWTRRRTVDSLIPREGGPVGIGGRHAPVPYDGMFQDDRGIWTTPGGDRTRLVSRSRRERAPLTALAAP
jgi:hypothetical protein